MPGSYKRIDTYTKQILNLKVVYGLIIVVSNNILSKKNRGFSLFLPFPLYYTFKSYVSLGCQNIYIGDKVFTNYLGEDKNNIF